MPAFFVPSSEIQGKTVTLDGPLYTHLHKSLRVRQGDRVLITDDQRRRHHLTIVDVTNKKLLGEIQETVIGPPADHPPITLAQSILKGDKMAWSIQKATELGVATVVPLVTERVQHKLDSHQQRHHQERWEKIALEAAQQSERWDIPSILPPRSLSSFLGDIPYSQQKLLLTARAPTSTAPPSPHHRTGSDGIILGVGPEGGWSQNEIEEAGRAGFVKISLGQRIMRSETAALAALIMVQAQYGQLSLYTITESLLPPGQA